MLAALAVLWLAASPVAAQPIVLGGDVVVPVENRPGLGLFVQGYINGHGPYRFALSFLDKTMLTPTVVREIGLVTEAAGIGLGALNNQVQNALTVKEAEIRIGEKAVAVDNVRVLSDRDLNTYTPVREFAGFIGVELLRNGFVTLNAERTQIRFARRSLEEAGETGSTPIPLGDSATNGIVAGPADPIPSVDITMNGRHGRLRLGSNGSGLAFFNTSKLGAALIKASPYRFQSIIWTPDGVTVFEQGAAVNIDIGDRRVERATIARVVDKAPFPVSEIMNGFPVEGIIGLKQMGPVAFSIDNAAGMAWIGPAKAADEPAADTPGAKAPAKSNGLMPWLYKGRGVAREIYRGGPADLAGIAPGDEIVSLNGEGVVEYYEHIDPKAKTTPPLTVVFRNGSGVHTAVLVAGLPRLD